MLGHVRQDSGQASGDRVGRLGRCVAYGPGRLELAHRPDERIAVDDMVVAAKVMARSLDRLLAARGGEA